MGLSHDEPPAISTALCRVPSVALPVGFEPTTNSLTGNCAANCATGECGTTSGPPGIRTLIELVKSQTCYSVDTSEP